MGGLGEKPTRNGKQVLQSYLRNILSSLGIYGIKNNTSQFYGASCSTNRPRYNKSSVRFK